MAILCCLVLFCLCADDGGCHCVARDGLVSKATGSSHPHDHPYIPPLPLLHLTHPSADRLSELDGQMRSFSRSFRDALLRVFIEYKVKLDVQADGLVAFING